MDLFLICPLFDIQYDRAHAFSAFLPQMLGEHLLLPGTALDLEGYSSEQSRQKCLSFCSFPVLFLPVSLEANTRTSFFYYRKKKKKNTCWIEVKKNFFGLNLKLPYLSFPFCQHFTCNIVYIYT